jgi:type II secretory pathway pseudopilin PulG
MSLAGQGGERGYAMAALLVALAVMSVMMSALLPAWRHQMKREREAELAFRGEQYVRAIGLYAAKNGGAFPPSIDVLVSQRYLRKEYKDPFSPDGEFQPRFAGMNVTPGGGRGVSAPGSPPSAAPRQQGENIQRQQGSVGRMPSTQPSQQSGVRGGGVSGGGTVGGGVASRGTAQPGGIIGVISKSRETSIRVYKGATRYNEWPFVYAGLTGRPGDGRGGQPGAIGAPVPGIGGRGNRGGPGGGRGRGFGPGRGFSPRPGGRGPG